MSSAHDCTSCARGMIASINSIVQTVEVELRKIVITWVSVDGFY